MTEIFHSVDPHFVYFGSVYFFIMITVKTHNKNNNNNNQER